MKICAIICEYNPFHNGHLYQINAAKRLSGADAILCLMSGNFVQRGEAAIFDKYTRAKHAIKAGADVVIELPTVFATSNAELFAKGAVHILSSIPDVCILSFGAEKADKTAFLLGARYLNNEPEEVSKNIKEQMQNGVSYAKARAQAFAGFIPFDLLASPNNILGLEYTRAILEKNATIDILPLQRKGAGYSDTNLQEEFSSATAIRTAVFKGDNVSKQIPDFVAMDIPFACDCKLDVLEKYAILAKDAKEIAKICDCNEGLENAFKKAALATDSLVTSLTSPRYTSARIRRIALQNLLGIQESLIRESLQLPLYLNVLAAKKSRSDVLSALSQGKFPLLIRAHDETCLDGVAKICYQADVFAQNVYALLNDKAIGKDIFID